MSFLLSVWSVVYSSNNQTIISGEIFQDNNGKHINAHGGGMMFFEGRYYWFGEHKEANSNAAYVGVSCYSSNDFYNWNNEGVALAVTDSVGSDLEKGCVLERPKVVYNKETNTFVMWFHLELKGKGYSAARVGLAISKKPTGPYKFVRSYRPNPGIYPINMTQAQRQLTTAVADFKQSWTPEWKSAIAEGLYVRRDLEGGQMSRDMTIFVDDDDKAYHIFASEDNLTLQIAELSDDYQSHTGKYIRVAPAGHNEAPSIFKKDGVYWMITSGCTGWKPNAARLAKATSIWGPWEQLPNPCIGKNADLTFGSQSTYIQKIEGYKDAFLFMADRWTPEKPNDGRYVWLPVLFNTKGIPELKWFDSWNFDVFKMNNLVSTQINE